MNIYVNQLEVRCIGRPDNILPEAYGRADIGKPIAAAIGLPLKQGVIGWPKFCDTAHDPSVSKLTDLVDFISQ